MPRRLIQSIFLLDDKIRYASVLNHRGNHLEGGMKPGKATLNPEEEEQKLFLQTTVSRGMSDSWGKYFDEFRFSIFARGLSKDQGTLLSTILAHRLLAMLEINQRFLPVLYTQLARGISSFK